MYRTFKVRLRMDKTTKSTGGKTAYSCGEIKEGKTIMYDGMIAKIIHVNPMMVIKVKDRVICGALGNHIKFIEENEKHFRS